MVLQLGSNKVKVLTNKHKTFIKLENEQTLDSYVVSPSHTYKTINTSLDKVFSNDGLTIGNYNIKALGTYTNMTVRILNTNTNKLTYLNNNEIVNYVFVENSKIPSYVKTILASLSERLETLDRKQKPQLRPLHNIQPKIPKQVLSVYCPLIKSVVSHNTCLLCSYGLSVSKKKILCILDQ